MRIDKDLFWYEKRVAELEALRLKDTERLKTLGEKVLALEQQNLALAAAIEVKDAAIEARLNPCGCFSGCEFCNGKITLEEALAVKPSPDLLAERDRSVVKANEQAERFEREWYLRGDELDEAKKLLLLAKEALENCEGMLDELRGFPVTHDLLIEALAAINNSKLVEGLILCDAEPVGEVEAIDVDDDAQPSAWVCINTDIELGTPLYSPRRTEK